MTTTTTDQMARNPSLAQPPAARELPGVRLAFASIVLAMLPAVLDQTILAAALPTVAADLGRLADVSWVVAAYVVAATAATPLWGKLGDRHSRRRLLELQLFLFVAASALCGLAHDITQLVAVRVVQGVAAGGLMTLAMAIVGELVPPRERGRYQGYIAATFAGATALGPLVGGLLVQHASWRWIFYVNLPVGALALAAVRAKLPPGPVERARAPFDALGAALLAGATTAFMLVCVWGGDRYAWGSVQIVSLISGALVFTVALVACERRAADPIVPVRMLATPVVALASAALFLGTASLFAITVFVPLFLQVAAGLSPTRAGLLLVPMMVATTISTTFSGRSISRSGRYKRFPLIGLGLMAAALALLAALARLHSATATGLGLAIFGLGFGLVTQVLVVAVQNSVERSQLGVATAATGFFRALGGAVGAAALGALFSASAGTSAGARALHGLAPALRAHVAGGVQTVFIVAAPLALVALLVVLRLPEVELKRG
jgi:EmrB/QacA subfamily drug resistance transporter